jgi:hypothetical protein
LAGDVTRRLRNERGVALIIALMAMTMMIAFGTALLLDTTTESKIAHNFRRASEATYAADAMLERVVADIGAVADWNALLSGATRSAFVDGAPSGSRTLADGTAIDLSEIVNRANCEKPSACAEDDMDRVTDERPWGLNNPRWQPLAWGRLNSLTPAGSVNSPFYVIVMVGDDPSECDNNPIVDGGDPVLPCGTSLSLNPGAGVLSLRAEAFGSIGTHKIIEATVTRTEDAVRVRMLSWREVR